MSRIHEALKRAELERATTQGVAAQSPAPKDPPPAGQTAALLSTEFARPTSAPENKVAAGNGHLEFSELQARRQVRERWNPDPNQDIFHSAQSGPGAEQFRTLRSRLYQLRNQHPLRTLLVTSSMAKEGKTFVSSNLARSIVRQAERRVLVIDADLRCPRLHSALGAPPAPGLSDYLRGQTDEPSIIHYGPEGNLCLIPCGTPISDPSELLSNGRLKTLLDRLGPAFDWIIVDSPPCLPVADAGIIANWCDGVLLVVRAQFTPSAVIQESRRELKQRNVVGVVLNAVKDYTSHSAYYGGYGSYGGHSEAAART
jgi:capsular exopolysaccharide synthesis family protein